MSAANNGTRFYASNPAGGTCSDELLGARLPQAPPASTIPDKEGYVKNRLTVRI
jgi:hypothetical protein